jgi:diadenosine tetraphosphate (Ap4A) HIT family hydrolase
MKIPQDNWLYDNKAFFVIDDKYPVTVGHLLVVSKRMATDYFELDDDERQLLSDAILNARRIIDLRYEADRRPDGYNIGMNCGEVAGQTVMHFHCHVIPRRAGDSDDPVGGVRKCVNGVGRY